MPHASTRGDREGRGSFKKRQSKFSGFSIQSGVENQKWAAKVGADRRDALRFRRVARRREGGFAAQVGRFSETTLPVFGPEKMAHGDAEIAEVRPMRGQGRGRSPRCPKIPARCA